MGNYREHTSKKMCLLNAICLTVIFAMNLYNIADGWSSTNPREQNVLLVLSVIAVALVAIGWYRFLCYDKKINTNQEEQNNE